MNTNGFTAEDFKRAATRPSIGDMVRSAELSDVVFFLRQEAHSFRRDASSHVRNLKPIDCDDLAGLFDAIADRIEAAAKREKAQLGNAAAMREALVEVRNKLPYFLQYMRLRRTDDDGGYYDRLLATINAALSAPARNCDVGTADEQEARFERHCTSNSDTEDGDVGCFGCPLFDNQGSCEFAWMQMPYEDGGPADET